jgi:hypothetical protein
VWLCIILGLDYWYNFFVVSWVHSPENDSVDVETCRDGDVNLKLHQGLML